MLSALELIAAGQSSSSESGVLPLHSGAGSTPDLRDISVHRQEATEDPALLAEKNLHAVVQSMQTQRTRDIDAFRANGIVTPAAVQYVRGLERRLARMQPGPRYEALESRVKAYQERIKPWIDENAAGLSSHDFDRYVKWLAKKRIAERGALYKVERKRRRVSPASHLRQLQYRREYYQRKKAALDRIPALKDAVQESNRQRVKDWTSEQQKDAAQWREKRRVYNLRYKTKHQRKQSREVLLVGDDSNNDAQSQRDNPNEARSRLALDLNELPPQDTDEEAGELTTPPSKASKADPDSIEYLFPDGEPTLETWRQVRILRGALQSRHRHLKAVDYVKSERRITEIETRIAAAVAAKGLSIDDWLLLERSKRHWTNSRPRLFADETSPSHQEEQGATDGAHGFVDGKSTPTRTFRHQRPRKECQRLCCQSPKRAATRDQSGQTRKRKTKKIASLYLSPDVQWGATRRRNWTAP